MIVSFAFDSKKKKVGSRRAKAREFCWKVNHVCNFLLLQKSLKKIRSSSCHVKKVFFIIFQEGVTNFLKITKYCYRVFSGARPNDQTWKRLDRTFDIEKACLQYVFAYVGSIHPTSQISSRSLSSYRCRVFHQCVSFDEPLSDWTLCNSCHNQDDHRYELAVFASVWPFSEVQLWQRSQRTFAAGDPGGWPSRPNARSWWQR